MTRTRMVSPELSAQGIRKSPNPMLVPSWSALRALGLSTRSTPILVDYGCGQLRNVKTLLSFSNRLVVVDTERQLSSPHLFYGKQMLASEFVKTYWRDAEIRVLTDSQFSNSRITADVIFFVNVFDVVPEQTRRIMLRVATRHLKEGGALVIIAPRNDSWTLGLCSSEKQYQDGHVFDHPRGLTYYRNWSGKTLQEWVVSRRLKIVRDLSIFRQVCLVCRPDGRSV